MRSPIMKASTIVSLRGRNLNVGSSVAVSFCNKLCSATLNIDDINAGVNDDITTNLLTANHVILDHSFILSRDVENIKSNNQHIKNNISSYNNNNSNNNNSSSSSNSSDGSGKDPVEDKIPRRSMDIKITNHRKKINSCDVISRDSTTITADNFEQKHPSIHPHYPILFKVSFYSPTFIPSITETNITFSIYPSPLFNEINSDDVMMMTSSGDNDDDDDEEGQNGADDRNAVNAYDDIAENGDGGDGPDKKPPPDLHHRHRLRSNDLLILTGQDLNTVLTLDDYNIKVDHTTCPLTYLSHDKLTCKLNKPLTKLSVVEKAMAWLDIAFENVCKYFEM
ncbi:hypothetical protein HELRODRAFT_168394 [Helobdella robusta]|uniref:Uncharacterized protein n=1 Tax=Helobdella robusta TaxID=6412 RepID=T1F0J5_HELRO|nr:hypothetical protein HELRODRAFT_168394 [Helobdella robusta]ESO09411.1 hypothetical protein HELRODRAFT_168394 [Helobdella robusta]